MSSILLYAPPLAIFGDVGPSEMLLLAVIALLLYGGDLPTAARKWGQQFAELKRHLNGVRDELTSVIYAEPDPTPRLAYQPPIDATPRTTVESSIDVGGEPVPAELPPDVATTT